MAQDHIGQGGVFFPLQLPQAADIPGHQVPAVFGAEIAELAPGGETVAEVVLAAHHVAVGGQEAGRLVVAADVFRYAVDKLHHPAGGALGHPLPGVDGMDSVGGRIGKVEGLDHSAPRFLV